MLQSCMICGFGLPCRMRGSVAATRISIYRVRTVKNFKVAEEIRPKEGRIRTLDEKNGGCIMHPKVVAALGSQKD